jgi:enoyl-CoA hydratase/carnithine racemase
MSSDDSIQAPAEAPSLLLRSDGPVTTLTLNRPTVRNALDHKTLIAIVDALRALADDSAVRVIVVTGAESTFCSGDDMTEAASMDATRFRAHIECFQEVTRCLRRAPQPVIASIAGHAQGGGLELALGCDLRIAGDDAWFACPEPRWGLTITNAASVLLAACMGETRARELTLLGEGVDAHAAARYGLVTEVVPAAELEARTAARAARLLEASPSALRLTKVLLCDEERIERALAAEVDAVMEAFASDDAREGLRAFAERRAPSYAELAP